jgi:hypothetical protein
VTLVLRLGRHLAVVLAVAAAPRLAGGVVAPIAAALVGATVLTVGVLRWLARIEACLFRPRPRRALTGDVVRQPADADPHVAFAQALALVADRYLAECRHDADGGVRATPPHEPGAHAR